MANIRKPKFKVGQLVRFPLSDVRTQRAREAGIILSIERAYELKDKFKTYYPDGTCRGELTTIKELSKRKFKGFAYKTKSVQPKGYTADYTMFMENQLDIPTNIDKFLYA
jgi:hypothetical protein|tara:strand:+ start:135 stop:464 length:330 start_codon:yes stop_codon:yes gene_type:complete